MDPTVKREEVFQWVEEGDDFSLKIKKNVTEDTESGSVFVDSLKESGYVVSEQASGILLRDIGRNYIRYFTFHILKTIFKPNIKQMVYIGVELQDLKLPDPKTVRFFFETLRTGDMEKMGLNTIILPCEEKIRGGMFCRLIVRKKGDFLTIGTYIEEKKDKWNNGTGFLFVE
ncbi:TPA: hypothetical protein DEP58_00545 [Patescibacteria group bacterium]|nr:MAG: hypothetical protein UU98_C0039G0009 [Parcubacteria group bacterium GW2011_GWD2_42_14]HCC04777.1 hypothetical protein [Patescibacteria group bacterium]